VPQRVQVETDFEQATAKALEMAATIGQKGPVAIRAAKKVSCMNSLPCASRIASRAIELMLWLF